MADVQHVEAAVGQHDAFAGFAPFGDAALQLVAMEDLLHREQEAGSRRQAGVLPAGACS